TIMELLAAGLKDESIARRLGMSLRTTRRHIADIMEELDAASRFQAGYRFAVQGGGGADSPGQATETRPAPVPVPSRAGAPAGSRST
ncbi:helix-turn-helix transcriptional regulator, partial [Kitasatospora sp. NPDC048540]|uniref:helix-turn-helix domain-containing protein n=1 Tax=Kitasatospora sp. NPDC048540 TaxID=3155634 RepID=UPI0033CC7D4C